MLLKGEGIAQEREQGFTWLKKSAEAGSTHGMHWLGKCLSNGWGTERNLGEAAAWFNKMRAVLDAD
jgi:TPR repeat protein